MLKGTRAGFLPGGTAACLMPALAARAQDLALTPTPSVPATAMCTVMGEGGHGLVLQPFHMHAVFSHLCHVKCDAEGRL